MAMSADDARNISCAPACGRISIRLDIQAMGWETYGHGAPDLRSVLAGQLDGLAGLSDKPIDDILIRFPVGLGPLDLASDQDQGVGGQLGIEGLIDQGRAAPRTEDRLAGLVAGLDPDGEA